MRLYFLCMKQMGRLGFMRQLLRDSRVERTRYMCLCMHAWFFLFVCFFGLCVCVCIGLCIRSWRLYVVGHPSRMKKQMKHSISSKQCRDC